MNDILKLTPSDLAAANYYGIRGKVEAALYEESPEVKTHVVKMLETLAQAAQARVTAAEQALALAKAEKRAVALLVDGVSGKFVTDNMNLRLVKQLRDQS